MTGNTEITESPYPWTKSSKSNGGNGGCVAWQWQADGGLWLRDDKDPNGPIQKYTPFEAECFLDAIGSGEFVRPAELSA